jgi:hypothetical protein
MERHIREQGNLLKVYTPNIRRIVAPKRSKVNDDHNRDSQNPK